MSSKNEQLRRLIEAMVRKEVKEILPTVVPQVVKEVMMGMINEAVVSPKATQIPGNSDKRRRLMEVDLEDDDLYEEPPMPRRTRRDMGPWDGGDAPVSLRESLNMPSKMATESGNLVPVSPDKIPDFIVRAMNRNYSDVLDMIKKKNA
jgi:hypothetical protein